MRQVFFVLGPGRSGTSTMTKALTTFGIDLGNNLMEPETGVNEKGFFEDLDIHALNTRLLEANGLVWHRLDLDDTSGLDSSLFLPRAKEILARKLLMSPRIGIKDPQLTRLLPFWRNSVAEVGATDYHVIATRNPTSVAKSLAKHTGFGLARCYELWFIFTLRSLLDTPPGRRIVVSYERMMDGPIGELKRIASKFDLDLDTTSDSASEFAESFVDQSLQHNRVPSNDVNSILLPKIVALNELMERLAGDANDLDDPKTVDEIAGFADLRRRETGLSGLVLEQERTIEDLQATVEDLRQSILSVVADRDAHKEHVEILGRQVNELVQRAMDFDAATRELRETVDNLLIERNACREALESRMGEIDALKAALSEATRGEDD